MLTKWKRLYGGEAEPRIVLQAYWFSGALAGVGCTLLASAVFRLVTN